ncbi:MAG: endonuclease V [Planctomycetes bacterium]|nr:endonuclease V [Planctomycetota bacterium]
MAGKQSPCPNDPGGDWPSSPAAAIEIQRRLAGQVRIEPLDVDSVERVAAVDMSFPGGRAVMHRLPAAGLAAAVVYDLRRSEVIESVFVTGEVHMPYIPGLLSFRECPLALEALHCLRTTYDVLLADGQGRAHPRRMGIACHLGLVLDVPAIGCAKGILVGEVQGKLGSRRGSRAGLVDRGETVGMAIRTRSGVKPVYVSVGHRVDLASAAALVERTLGRYRIPEPLRQAHIVATQMRRRGV